MACMVLKGGLNTYCDCFSFLTNVNEYCWLDVMNSILFDFNTCKHYKNLVWSYSADYARSLLQKNATLEPWTGLIDGRWIDEEWLVNYLCVYYYYPMFIILCFQLIRLILRWSKCILFYSWSNKYLECCLLEKEKRKNSENR